MNLTGLFCFTLDSIMISVYFTTTNYYKLIYSLDEPELVKY